MRRQEKPSRVAGTPLLIVLAMAQFMVVLDFTIINVALPSIQAGLHIGTSTLQWLISGYAVVVRRIPAAGRQARRPVRPGPHVPDRAGRLRAGQRGRRARRRAGPAHRLAGRAGNRRRDRGPGRAVPARDQLARGTRPQPRTGDLRSGRLDRVRLGRGARRPPGAGELAAGVLRQRPDRRGPAGLLLAAARFGAGPPGRPGPARRGHRHRRRGADRASGSAGRRHPHRGRAAGARAGRGAPAGRLRPARAPGGQPPAGPGAIRRPGHPGRQPVACWRSGRTTPARFCW